MRASIDASVAVPPAPAAASGSGMAPPSMRTPSAPNVSAGRMAAPCATTRLPTASSLMAARFCGWYVLPPSLEV